MNKFIFGIMPFERPEILPFLSCLNAALEDNWFNSKNIFLRIWDSSQSCYCLRGVERSCSSLIEKILIASIVPGYLHTLLKIRYSLRLRPSCNFLLRSWRKDRVGIVVLVKVLAWCIDNDNFWPVLYKTITLHKHNLINRN